MSTKISFPYHYKKIEFGQIPNPYLDLKVETSQGWQLVRFLVDSGADVTTLPLFLAEVWEIRIDKRKKTTMGGVGGKGVKAYPSKVKVKLGEDELEIRCYFIESEVIPLLGRIDLWDQYNLLFDNKRQEIVFRRIRKSTWDCLLEWFGFS